MLESIIDGNVTLSAFVLCSLTSAILGLLTAFAFRWRSRTSGSLFLTLALLPMAVQTVIMLVNGNLGVGVAVAGTFSLVRFRSAPGTGREIAAVFVAMALGLAAGMGYIGFAFLFWALASAFLLLLTRLGLGAENGEERTLRITIPENLEYEGLFDDLFSKYTRSAELERVKTTNMGTLYELRYRVLLPGGKVPKAFLDDLRTRNGNLNVSCGRTEIKEQL
ncbi:MAG: DUF4956 domain-containing protein [Clostridiaceae bacterium]|nr:DUF4956 domain-containing protein [Clostridiaceae bacterium]